METAEMVAMNLTDSVFAIIDGDAQFKADVAGHVVDALIGSDPHSLVRSIKGVPESMVELISDGLISALKENLVTRLVKSAT